jgi:tryptophanyl-tRNA synthetase
MPAGAKTAVTGVQATGGSLHLGNYLGALASLASVDPACELFLFVADLHSLTTHDGVENIFENSLNVAATFLACCPRSSVLFLQSDVPQHSELCWILSSIAQYGQLSRMTQFKDKAQKNQSNINLGLFSYPVLMAADILIYNASYVPVGDDQRQHLEFTRDIALAFNKKYNTEVFNIPEATIPQDAARIMSLSDGAKKMSKSDPSDASRINLLDSDDLIVQKIKRARSDSAECVGDDFSDRPEMRNLVTIFSALSGLSHADVVARHCGSNMSTFKSALADIVIAGVGPLRDRICALLQDRGELLSTLQRGRDRATEVAEHNIANVKRAVRLCPPAI